MMEKGTDLFIENRQAVFVVAPASCRWSSYGVKFSNRKKNNWMMILHP